jgi:hypothetical protein
MPIKISGTVRSEDPAAVITVAGPVRLPLDPARKAQEGGPALPPWRIGPAAPEATVISLPLR